MEEPFEPTDELGLCDPLLRSRRGTVGRIERQVEAFEFLDEVLRQAVFEFVDGAAMDLGETFASLLIEFGAADFFEELLDHGAAAHHLRR